MNEKVCKNCNNKNSVMCPYHDQDPCKLPKSKQKILVEVCGGWTAEKND
jgi:hypothetical protein